MPRRRRYFDGSSIDDRVLFSGGGSFGSDIQALNMATELANAESESIQNALDIRSRALELSEREDRFNFEKAQREADEVQALEEIVDFENATNSLKELNPSDVNFASKLNDVVSSSSETTLGSPRIKFMIENLTNENQRIISESDLMNKRSMDNYKLKISKSNLSPAQMADNLSVYLSEGPELAEESYKSSILNNTLDQLLNMRDSGEISDDDYRSWDSYFKNVDDEIDIESKISKFDLRSKSYRNKLDSLSNSNKTKPFTSSELSLMQEVLEILNKPDSDEQAKAAARKVNDMLINSKPKANSKSGKLSFRPPSSNSTDNVSLSTFSKSKSAVSEAESK